MILYDELDALGAVVKSGIHLLPTTPDLPTGHTYVVHVPGAAEQAALAAEQARVAADIADHDAVKSETLVQTFISMTPAQVASYIDANVTNLASAKNVLKLMGRMLLLLARGKYR